MKTMYRQIALAAMLACAVVVNAQDQPAAAPATAANVGENAAANQGYLLGYKIAEQIKRQQKDLDAAAFTEGFKAGLADKHDAKQASYGAGVMVSREFKDDGMELDAAEFGKGVADCLGGTPIKFTEDEQKTILDKMRSDSQQRQLAKVNKQKADNLAAAKKFLEENKTKEGITTTASGLQYKVIKSGDAAGKSPAKEDMVKVNYRGTLVDGTEFDSSEKHGGPAEFGVGQVIKGWTEALQLMKPGDKWQLFIPPDIAYGERGTGSDIQPNSALIFEVELLEVQKSPAAPADPANK